MQFNIVTAYSYIYQMYQMTRNSNAMCYELLINMKKYVCHFNVQCTVCNVNDFNAKLLLFLHCRIFGFWPILHIH